MTNRLTVSDLKLRLKTDQVKAAELLVYNQLKTEGRKSEEEIAGEVGVTRRTIWNWKQDRNFILYMSTVSDSMLDQHRSLADAQMLRLVKGTSNNGIPSIKGLELYYKITGRLQEAPMVQFNDQRNPTMSREEASRELEGLVIDNNGNKDE